PASPWEEGNLAVEIRPPAPVVDCPLETADQPSRRASLREDWLSEPAPRRESSAAAARIPEGARAAGERSLLMVTLGIDVSKDTLALALWREGTVQVLDPVPNTPKGWEQLVGALAKQVSAAALIRLDVVLARYGAERPLALWQPLPSEVSELEALLRRREEVQGLLQQERNRAQQLKGRPGIDRKSVV